jgi:hypothetical protein
MRFFILAGALVLAAGPAMASFQVELDGGDHMTVDSYWEDGDRIHLMREGVDLNVLKSRVKVLRWVDGGDAPARPKSPTAAASAAPAQTEKASRAELEAQETAIEKHLLRVQQEKFEAANRGDAAATQRRLKKEFERTQARRRDVIRALEQ